MDDIVRPRVGKRPDTAQQRPIPPGTIVGKVPRTVLASETMTPAEEAVLRQFQVNPDENISLAGNPAAAKLTNELLGVKQHATKVQPGEAMPTTAFKGPPPAVDIASLSPEEQESILAMIGQQRAKRAQAAKTAALQGELSEEARAKPGLAEAYSAARQTEPETFTIEDDVYAKQEFVKAPDQPAEEHVDSTPQQAPDLPLHKCAMCGGDPRGQPAEVSSLDKTDYLATEILGGGRFTKSYPLFGNRIAVTFRALTTWEGDQARAQAERDVRALEISSFAAYTEAVMRYRLCMAIHSIRRSGEATEFNTLADIKADETATAVQRLTAYIMQRVIASESVYNAVWHAHQKFRQVVETIEARREEPDFL